MKKFVFFLIAFNLNFANAEEPMFQFTFGSNIKNFPIQINKSNQKIKKPFSINLNEWMVSPGFLSLVNDKSSLSSYKANTTKEKIFVKFKIKF